MQLYRKDFLLINFRKKYFTVAIENIDFGNFWLILSATVWIYEKDFLLIDFQTYFTVAIEKNQTQSTTIYIFCFQVDRGEHGGG